MTDAALALLAAARRLAETGLNPGSAGNLSVRTAAGFLITPSGIAPEELTADMMVPMTLDGAHSGPCPPVERMALPPRPLPPPARSRRRHPLPQPGGHGARLPPPRPSPLPLHDPALRRP